MMTEKTNMAGVTTGKKLYISADLEGVCGVVSPDQCSPEPDRTAYDRAVRQLHREVAVVAETALASGVVSQVVVNDAHCTMTNLDWSAMPDGVTLISGKPKRLAMMAGLDHTFDGVILIGYHARAGALNGVLCHTYHHRLFDVSMNGASYGEVGINAIHAGTTYGVPILMVSGDRALREEVAVLGKTDPAFARVLTVETKVGLGQTTAICHPWEQVKAEFEKTTQALIDHPDRWQKNVVKQDAPYTVTITFLTSLAADTAALALMPISGAERVDGRTLRFQCDDFTRAFGCLQASYTILAATASLESY